MNENTEPSNEFDSSDGDEHCPSSGSDDDSIISDESLCQDFEEDFEDDPLAHLGGEHSDVEANEAFAGVELCLKMNCASFFYVMLVHVSRRVTYVCIWHGLQEFLVFSVPFYLKIKIRGS
jgi:hypothetical protein